jgi:hypothetical protein
MNLLKIPSDYLIPSSVALPGRSPASISLLSFRYLLHLYWPKIRTKWTVLGDEHQTLTDTPHRREFTNSSVASIL